MVIEIVNYNKNWPLKYAGEANQIRNIILNDLVSIYHIGATSIKGLRARPMIDILIVIKSITVINELKPELEKLGYECFEGEVNFKGHYFKRKDDSFCLYIFSVDEASEIERFLAVSLYLREHQDLACEYTEIKGLAAKKSKNGRRYFKEKNRFITNIENEACLWYRSKDIHIA